MPLHLHRAQRSDALVSGLADVLADPLDDPMATEIVAVPAKGIERWITQRLAHRLGMTDGDDGVSANVDFSSPGRLVARTLSVAGGVDPDTDPWEVERLSWPLLSVIDESVGDPAFAALADHLGAAGSVTPGGRVGGRIDDRRTELRRSRRLAVARRLAGLFDDYSVHRPTVLQAWANGDDSDGAGEPLARQRRWQAELFRRVRARIGAPSPAERLPGVFDTLLTNPNSVDLPSRFSVFGATRLSTRELGVLDALAHRRDVHIWIPQPSPKLWASLGGEAADDTLVRRRTDPTAGRPLHPLLRSLGRDSRELQLRLRSCRAPVVDTLHPDIAAAPVGALSILQRHLAQDVRPPGAPIADEPDARELLPADDRSIQVHACHGRDRQVEVLRDVLVGLLADDETLQPRDILVMCPDIELYAPLILAAFGVPGSTGELVGGGSHPGTRIRVRLADRALRRTNPVLDVLARVLELADSRMSASDVLDFADLPPVRRRFGFDDDALQRLRDWVTASGVRWGLNERSRARYGLQALPQNTWRTGLNRILLGVAMSEDEPGYLGLALPLDDVESSDIDLAGRLAELVDRLAISAQQLSGSQSLQAWVTALTEAVDGLASVPVGDSWQREQAHRTLREAVEHAGPQAMSAELRLADVAGLFADALRGRPTRANFRTGELTICSMVPMRSVPHRVICLLGLDDGEFPRTGLIDGDDVLAVDPLVGERDRTSEDRQLTLDAVNAATEHLVLLYSGADHRTGAARPPAAALGEILDVLDASMRTIDGPARDQLLIRHPLQPFDDRNFTPGALVAGDAFSFDAAALAGARSGGARRSGSTTSSTLLDRPLPDPPAPQPGDVLELDTLIRFFDHPAKAFLRERLGLAGSWADPPLRDELSVTVDPLVKYAIGDRLLRQRLAGVPATVAQNLEYRRGELPPGRQASTVLAELMADVDGLIQESGPGADVVGEQYDVAIAMPAGRTLVGTIGPLRDGVLAATNYSSLSAKHRLQAWIGVLALAAGDPGFVVRGVTIGRGGRGKAAASSRVSAPAAAEARAILENLVAVRDLGLRMPLPLPPKTACVYVESRLRFDADPAAALDRAAGYWTGGEYGGDGDDAEHRLVFGVVALPAIADLPDIDAAHRRAGEPTTFGDLAMQIYAPLVRAERPNR